MKRLSKKVLTTLLVAGTIISQVMPTTIVDAYTAASIAKDKYIIKNVYNGKYLNIVGSKDKNGVNVNIYEKDGTTGQTFTISQLADGYSISPQCSSTGRVVNVTGSAVVSGANVNLYNKDSAGDDTQLWAFEQVANGYVIRSLNNEDCVLTSVGTTNSSNVCVSTYTGSNKQVWQLEKVGTSSSSSTTTVTSSTGDKTVSQIEAQIATTYAQAKAMTGRTNFSKQCSLYVYSQLRALKIYQVPDTYWNGSLWYSKLTSYGKTSTGYTQIKYSGVNCLTKLINANGGKDVYNIVVSFPKSYRSTSTVGHVLFIHAIKDGKVYYSDNYRYAGKAEGSMLVKTVSEFTNYFSSNYSGINGAVHFVK